MNYFQTARYIFILFIVLLISACGFHLRGISNIPNWLNQVAIISENNDKEFVSLLEARLKSSHVQISSDPSHANYWLIVNELNLQQQIISVGASTNPRQYTLTLTVGFMLKSRSGEIIEIPNKINVFRQLTLNNDRILGSQDEERILIGEMKQDAMTQIIYRLGHAPNPKKPLN